MTNRTNKYVAFSGIDGSGKSSQAAYLATYLRKQGHQVALTREPGSNLLSFNVRDFVLSKKPVSPQALELLIQADRAEHTFQIERLLDQGYWVISDRSYMCGLAYSLANGHSMETMAGILRFALRCKPDAAFLMNLTTEESLQRRAKRAAEETREESKGNSFMDQVAQRYLQVFSQDLPEHLEPSTKIVVPANGTFEDIAQSIRFSLSLFEPFNEDPYTYLNPGGAAA